MAENRFRNTEHIEELEPVVMPEPVAEPPVEPEPKAEETTPKSQVKSKKSARKIMNVLGGGFLVKEQFAHQIPFMIYVTVLLMALITNTYIAEEHNRDIATATKELNDLHVEYIQLKSAIMQASKQSVLAKKLSNAGIKEPVEPLKRINPTTEQNTEEKP